MPNISASKIAGMLIFQVARQRALRLDRLRTSGEDRYAVERLLPMPDCAIARTFEVGDREALVLRFYFLQTGNVGLGFLQPFEQAGQAGFDAVDIIGRDTHSATLAGGGYRIKPKSWSRSRNRLGLADW